MLTRRDVAGAGNGLTVRLVRHSHRKRGETDRPRLRSTAPALDPTAIRLAEKAEAGVNDAGRCRGQGCEDEELHGLRSG